MTFRGTGRGRHIAQNSQSDLCTLYSKQFTVKMHKKLHTFCAKRKIINLHKFFEKNC